MRLRNPNWIFNRLSMTSAAEKSPRCSAAVTAAVVSPVGKIAMKDKEYVINGGKTGPVASKLFETLAAIQYGVIDDPFNWIVSVD